MDIKELSVSKVKELVDAQEKLDSELLCLLENDNRMGVNLLAKQYRNSLAKKELLLEQFTKMHDYENHYWAKGHEFVAGIDEAGCGPLAGPVVAAAVILPKDTDLMGLNDSKKLTEAKRKYYADAIREQAVAWAVAQASPTEIERFNIYKAAQIAMARAVERLDTPPTALLIDAKKLPQFNIPQEPIIKGDSKSISIAAASVLAKVSRDALMLEYDRKFPMYGFKDHMGYGTAAHMVALKKHGPCLIHRKGYAPVDEAYAEMKKREATEAWNSNE